MFNRANQLRRWNPGSAHVDGNLDSPHPTWIMTVARGRYRVEVATGPLHTRRLGEQLAAWLNAADVDRWDYIIEHELRHVLDGSWG